MRNIQRRLHKLEQLPRCQPPPSLIQEIGRLALRRLSNEELEVMINMRRALEAGVRQAMSERESTVVATYEAILEAEAQRMGFASFAEAEQKGGR